MTYTHFIV